MEFPPTYIVTPEQLGDADINFYLRKQIAVAFGDDCYIATEQTIDRIDPLTKQRKKIKGYCVTVGSGSYTVYFDVTAVSQASQTSNSYR